MLVAVIGFSGEAEVVKTATQASPDFLCTYALRGINQRKPLGFEVPNLIPADLIGRMEDSGSSPWKQKLIRIISHSVACGLLSSHLTHFWLLLDSEKEGDETVSCFKLEQH